MSADMKRKWQPKKRGQSKRHWGDDEAADPGRGNQDPTISIQQLRQGRAILYTCEVGLERRAGLELKNILQSYLDDAQASVQKEAAAHEASVRESLESEIEEMKSKELVRVRTDCGGTGGVSIPEEFPVDPVTACVRILQDAKAGQSRSRHLIKLMPMERLCYGDVSTLKPTLQSFLDGHPALSDAPMDEKPTYMVSLNRRHYALHTRDELMEAIGECARQQFVVDLKAPDYVLIMEAVKGTIGFSLVRDFNVLQKYNVRAAAAVPAGSTTQEQKAPHS